MRSGDTGDQRPNLSEKALNFGRFLPYQILGVQIPDPIKFVPKLLCSLYGTLRGKVLGDIFL